MPRTHRILLTSLTLLLLGLVAGAVVLQPEALPAPEAPQAVASMKPRLSKPSEPAPTAPISPSRSSTEGRRAWVPGMKYRYTLSSTQEVSFAPTQPGAETPPGMRFSLRGEWSVGVVSVEGDQIHVLVQLVPSLAEVNVGGETRLAPEVQRSFEAGLAQPFFATLDRSGAVQLVHFEPGADILVQNLLRATLATTQHVVPTSPQATWVTQELDTTGRYSARYTRQSASRFEKSKLAYSHLVTPDGLQPLQDGPRVSISALTSFELGEDLWVRSLQGREHLEVDSGSSLVNAAHSLQVELLLVERARDNSLLGAFDAHRHQLVTLPVASYLGQEQDPKAALRQTLAGKTFDTLVKDLRSLPSNEEQSQSARSQALQQLRALFLLEPGQALLAHAALREGMDPLAASPLIGALSSASTPECIQALSDIVADGALPSPMRVDATASLGLASAPTEEGVTALRKLSHGADAELASTATLGMGSAALMMDSSNKHDADALVHELSSAYLSASNPDQQALLLRALGNTRSPSALPTLESALSSKFPGVRSAAVEALRNMPAPSADRLLASVLLRDPIEEVRQTAVFATSFRPIAPLLPVLSQVLRLDSSDLVRREIITLAGDQFRAVPEARALLEWSSQNEPNPGLRRTALTLLTSRTP
ncbi:HEAT repeat domain-containing protein [Hyalangium versicolor]|uniref:HEAT repeat domain-containing protein n=1 Tax=Hyalangium versicolor TaxID=2861190 RepID=UPI001CCB0396|nr:HEAT repeat domain-containing protein [Hyalangium versicolor]